VGALGNAAATSLRREEGYALTELLVGTALALALIGSAVGLFTSSVRSQPRISDRAGDIGDARVFAESVSRELRQGVSIPTATASQLTIVTYVKRASCGGSSPGPAIACRVTYTCASGACSRVVANVDGSAPGPAVQVVAGLADPGVFSYSPDAVAPRYVGIRVAIEAAPGEDAITIEDGVALRNPAPEAPPA